MQALCAHSYYSATAKPSAERWPLRAMTPISNTYHPLLKKRCYGWAWCMRRTPTEQTRSVLWREAHAAGVLFRYTAGMHSAWRVYSRHGFTGEKMQQTLQGVHTVSTDGEYTSGALSFMIHVYRKLYVWQSEHSASSVLYTIGPLPCRDRIQ